MSDSDTVPLTAYKHTRPSTEPASRTQNIRIAVIGGGPVGVVTLKTFLRSSNPESRIQATLFEAEKGVGGSFKIRSYDGGMLRSSKQATAFSDYRFGHDSPNHISFADYVKYLERYCSHFSLWPHIMLQTRVSQVELLHGEEWLYRIHYVSTAKDGEIVSSTFNCSHIAVCTALQADPYQPNIPGLSAFPGKVYHAAEYKGPSQLTGEHVLILGSGESATDIAYDGVRANAKTVTMCFRNGFLSIPNTFNGFQLFGKSFGPTIALDWLTTNLFETAYVHPIIASSRLHWFLKDIIMKLAMSFLIGNRADLNQEVGRLPLRSWRKVFVNRHDEITLCLNRPYKKSNKLSNLSDGTHSSSDVSRCINTCTFPSYIFPNGHIQFTPDANRKDYHRMVKGPPVHATTIIFCTGYSEPRSFLPPSCPGPSKAACRLIVAPEWPTIAHMGHIRFWDGAIGPAAEMQAMWYLAYLEGRMKQLPKSEEHYSLLSPEGGYMSYGVDYSAYMAALAEDIGAKPKLLHLLQEYGWEVFWAYCFGACFVSFYRLIGPFKEAHQMRTVVKGELLRTVGKKGWIGILVFGMIPTIILGLLNGLAWVLEIVGLLRLTRVGRRARSTMSRSVV